MTMHVALLPFPSLGHINSLLAIAKLLQYHGFRITVFLTQDMALKFTNSAEEEEEQEQEEEERLRNGIRYVGLPCMGMEDAAEMDSSWAIAPHILVMKSMRQGFEKHLRRDGAMEEASRIGCVIADCFVTWAMEVAAKLGKSGFMFVTTNAQAMATYFLVDSERSEEEASGYGGSYVDGRRRRRQEWLSAAGLGALRAADLPQSVRERPEFVKEVVGGIRSGGAENKGVIVNTAYEIGREAMEAVAMEVKKEVYSVAPLMFQLLSRKEEITRSNLSSKMGRIWAEAAEAAEEEERCLKWLDSREEASVVYLCFGSLAMAEAELVKELAEGLAESGESFLWVLRSPPSAASSSPLPLGFSAATRRRGLVVSWAPQLRVLSHPSISAFLTHCGWNSIAENLCTGAHPMICCPQIAEQRLNASLLVQNLGVAIHLLPPSPSASSSSSSDQQLLLQPVATISQALLTALSLVMRGPTRARLKSKMVDLKQSISQSVAEGGRSHASLQALLHSIKSSAKSQS